MDEANLAQKTARCLRAMLDCGALGARHGPRLGMQVGAICGTIFPIVGNLVGAALGGLVGGPLGFLMGLVGGAVNRRWGWTLGAALPALGALGVMLFSLIWVRSTGDSYSAYESVALMTLYAAFVAMMAGVAGSNWEKRWRPRRRCISTPPSPQSKPSRRFRWRSGSASSSRFCGR